MGQTNSKNREWFRNTPLGIFFHWGVYSVLGRGEWVMHQEQIPLEEYDAQIPLFKVENYNPEEWAAVAKAAGAEYMVLTTKHHDGFCLFDTATTTRNAVRQGPKRDLVRPYADACRKYGLKVGLYYSPHDWSNQAFNDGKDKNPAAWDAYINMIHTQVRELMINYGKIDILWYDGAPNLHGKSDINKDTLRSAELNSMVRQLQPQILINKRSGLPEDFDTSEQNIVAPADHDRLWESCITMNSHWGYFPADIYYKHPFEIMKLMTATACTGGHLLLNMAPLPDGRLQEQEIQILKTVGKWLDTCGESLRGTSRVNISGASYGCASQKGSTVYLYVHWPTQDGIVTIPNCTETFQNAMLLNDGRQLTMERKGNHLLIKGLPPAEPEVLPVVKLTR
ncbi:MAG: alpha-L-fucosidase [Victivallales bacterium]|nr:alpha-L-fucosidase [Victivallales bacterium]